MPVISVTSTLSTLLHCVCLDPGIYKPGNISTLISVDLPATWMMDQFFPPPPDLTNLDAEAKLGILREEESRHKNRRSVRAQRYIVEK